MYDSVTASLIATYRAKALDRTLTLDEMRHAVKMLREGRSAATEAAKAAGRKGAKPKAVVNMDTLFDGLD